MGPALTALLLAGIFSGAAFTGWRVPESRLFMRMLANAHSATVGSYSAGAVSSHAPALSPACLRAGVVALAAGGVAGALVIGAHKPLLEEAWLVPWAGAAALFGAVDLSERVVPTPAARAASAGTVALIVLNCAVSGDWPALGRALGCGALVWCLLAAWSVLSPRALGFGDARAALFVSLGAGAVSPPGILAGLAGAHLAAGICCRLQPKDRRGQGVPLVPFLALAGLAVVVAGAL